MSELNKLTETEYLRLQNLQLKLTLSETAINELLEKRSAIINELQAKYGRDGKTVVVNPMEGTFTLKDAVPVEKE